MFHLFHFFFTLTPGWRNVMFYSVANTLLSEAISLSLRVSRSMRSTIQSFTVHGGTAGCNYHNEPRVPPTAKNVHHCASLFTFALSRNVIAHWYGLIGNVPKKIKCLTKVPVVKSRHLRHSWPVITLCNHPTRILATSLSMSKQHNLLPVVIGLTIHQHPLAKAPHEWLYSVLD